MKPAIEPKPQVVALYVLVASDCPACIEYKPTVAAFQKERRSKMPVLVLNLDRKEWTPGGYHAKATPASVLLGDGKIMRAFEGVLNLTQLRSFVDGPWRVQGASRHTTARKKGATK